MKNYKFLLFFRMILVVAFIICCFLEPVYGYGVDEVEKDAIEIPQVCNVLLEPLQTGKSTSRILSVKCGTNFNLHDFGTNAYFLAHFYDDVNYRNILISYYGTEMCSSSISYGVSQVSSSIDNRISSGAGYSGCNYIYVYDLANYTGDSTSCFANCSSFGSINDRVSSWRITN